MSEESLIKATEPQTEATEETPVTEEKDFVTAEDQIVRPEWLPEKFKKKHLKIDQKQQMTMNYQSLLIKH